MLTAVLALALSPRLAAQSSTAADVAQEELELKQKELDLKKAQLAEIELEKQKLDVEKQKIALEQARQDLQVKETAERIDMQLQSDVLFDTNKATIKSDAKPTLNKVATVLSAFPDGKITVTGHADARGSDDRNLELSQERAEAVKTWLQAKAGVPGDRIITIAEGEDAPVASNQTAEGRQLNRRVEISVAKL